jgi:hypothetical protein
LENAINVSDESNGQVICSVGTYTYRKPVGSANHTQSDKTHIVNGGLQRNMQNHVMILNISDLRVSQSPLL